jgi:hypothetical protein
MNEALDLQVVERLRGPQRGVFSSKDLRTALAEPHRAAFYRRVERLLEVGALQRFAKGFYVAPDFDLPTLSQRLAPDSAVSFETVLARALLIGPRPVRAISAIRSGASARYEALGVRIEHHQLSKTLRFGENLRDGVRFTDAEKAMLDVLLFHQRGRTALIDIRSDVALERLERSKLEDYLERYRNPRFVAFARNTLRLR